MTNKEFLAEIENSQFRPVKTKGNQHLYFDGFRYCVCYANEEKQVFCLDIVKQFEYVSFTFENLEEVRTFFRCLKPF